jgi:hypothetical protein
VKYPEAPVEVSVLREGFSSSWLSSATSSLSRFVVAAPNPYSRSLLWIRRSSASRPAATWEVSLLAVVVLPIASPPTAIFGVTCARTRVTVMFSAGVPVSSSLSGFAKRRRVCTFKRAYDTVSERP